MEKHGITLSGICERLNQYLMPKEKSALSYFEAEIASLKDKLKAMDKLYHAESVAYYNQLAITKQTITQRNTQIADLRGRINKVKEITDRYDPANPNGRLVIEGEEFQTLKNI